MSLRVIFVSSRMVGLTELYFQNSKWDRPKGGVPQWNASKKLGELAHTGAPYKWIAALLYEIPFIIAFAKTMQ